MLLRLFESPYKKSCRLAAAAGWPVMEKSGHALAAETATSLAADILARDGISGFLAYYDRVARARATVGDYERCYALAEPVATLAFDDPDITPGRAQLKLRLYEHPYHETGRSPGAAALYARALLELASLQCGPQWSALISQEAAEKRSQSAELARDVLRSSAPQAAGCLLWHRIRFQMGLLDATTPEDLNLRFRAVLDCDQGEPGIFTERAIQLLPRWYGSFEELEAFAVQAGNLAAPEIAGTIYARIYAAIGAFENLRDTNADWHRLKISLEAWYQATRSQRLLNVYAACADVFADETALGHVLETRMAAFFPSAWFSAEQAAQALARMPPRR
jgi:hypothetical protein